MSEILAHQVSGSGERVVLLSGGMMSHSAWGVLVAALETDYEVLRFDFRGQLLSPGPAPDSLEGHAADVEALLAELGWQRAHFMGASFGAMVAVVLANRRPDLVASLLAITVGDHADDAFSVDAIEARKQIRDVLAHGGDKAAIHRRVIETVYSPEFRERQGAALEARLQHVAALPDDWFEGVAEILEVVETYDLRPYLRPLAVPGRVVIAGRDTVTLPARGRALAEALGVETVEHPDSGHALVVEQAEWLNGVARDFLAEASG